MQIKLTCIRDSSGWISILIAGAKEKQSQEKYIWKNVLFYLDAGLPDGGQLVLQHMHKLTLTHSVPTIKIFQLAKSKKKKKSNTHAVH